MPEGWFNDVNEAIQNLERAHDGEGDVHVLEARMQMATRDMQRI